MAWKRVERGIRRRTDSAGKCTYYVDVTRRGRRIVKAVGPNLDMARQIRGQLLVEAAEREHFPERRKLERIRLGDFCDRYLEDYLKLKASKSWRKELNRVTNIRTLLGDPFVDAITAGDVERLLATLRRKGDRPATLNRYRSRLNSMFRRAIAWGYRADNPVDGLERLREEKKGDRYLQPHEFIALLEACDPKLRPLVHVAGMTGMRQGELLAMDWQDVDLELGFVTVRARVSKTSEGRRVPLNAVAQAVLHALGPRESGRVFPFESFPNKAWRKAIKQLGWDQTEIPRLAGWRFHDMRHCLASWLVMADVPLTKVAKILGHKALATTQRYAHLSDTSLVHAMDRLPQTGIELARQTSVKRAESGQSLEVETGREPA